MVTPATIGHADELVDFFTGIGCQSVGFNIEEEEGAGRQAVDESAAYTFWRRLVERREHDSPLAIRDLDRLLEHVAATRAGQPRQRPFDPIPTVAYNGDTVLLSPELLGIHSDVYDDFVAGNVLRTSISNMIANAKRLRYVTEFSEALQTCAADCEFYAFCGGAQAGNRYFEHGTFAVAETAYCRNTRQSLVRATVDHITERTSA